MSANDQVLNSKADDDDCEDEVSGNELDLEDDGNYGPVVNGDKYKYK